MLLCHKHCEGIYAQVFVNLIVLRCTPSFLANLTTTNVVISPTSIHWHLIHVRSIYQIVIITVFIGSYIPS
jgi:hypothetical protein